jgi:hypothetical protein
VAGILSGLPSTLIALRTGDDPLRSSKAAGTLLLPGARSTVVLLSSAAVAHVALSLGWAVALARLLPRGREVPSGALAGLLIAAFDLTIGHRTRPAIRDLPLGPQVADHLAYGTLVGLLLARTRRAG